MRALYVGGAPVQCHGAAMRCSAVGERGAAKGCRGRRGTERACVSKVCRLRLAQSGRATCDPTKHRARRGDVRVCCSAAGGGAERSTATPRESGEPAEGGCEQCHGAGMIACPVCDAKGVFTVEMMGTVSSTACPMCRGKKKTPCPTCKRDVYTAVKWWDQVDPDDPTPRVTWGSPPPS
uniref:CR-type domain-containing protein n=1 Tax=Erythrolobus australicus TaxID=1077150 RepID=A0A7S1TN03_9RHOD|mmetsp:Transcript_5014/g.13510  ORF Transcript_5014/g.13510 Transcript_5014/m.13510 type:complete len:179 (+) Transcript_5014:56-592(+)